MITPAVNQTDRVRSRRPFLQVFRSSERGVAMAIVAVASLELAAGLLLGSIRFMSVDEAKYLGIGMNVLTGHGPLTVFDRFFPYHSPLWPAIVVAPQVLFGFDPLVWAHALNVVSAVSIVLLGTWFGWRIRPAVGAATACLLLGFAYFLSLGRTLGLDLPAAALCLAYVAVGLTAIRLNSVRLALLAGAIFATAFLVKEIALPFAPVPALAGLVSGRPVRSIARLAACMLAVAVIGSSWWFIAYAQATGDVYRLGTPAWTLGPLALALAGLIAIGWSAPRLLPDRLTPGPHATTAVGWVLTVAWSVILTGFFGYTRLAIGQPFLSLDQVETYAARWLDELTVVTIVGGVGAAIAAIERIRAALGPRPDAGESGSASGIDDLLVTTICGLPLILLVVSVGELPRHYIAQAVCLIALGVAGWTGLIMRAIRSPDRVTATVGVFALVVSAVLLVPSASGRLLYKVVIGALLAFGVVVVAIRPIRHQVRRIATSTPAAVLALLLAVGSVVLMTVTVRAANTPDEDAKAKAVTTAAEWIRANVPPGSTIAFAALLAYETADQLQGTYRSVQIREDQDVLFDPRAPLAVGRRGAPLASDWVALDVSPNINGVFYGYQARALQARLARSGTRIWVVSTITNGKSIVPIIQAVQGAAGISVRAHWSWPYDPGILETYVLAIDPAALSLPTAHMYVSQPALDELIKLLGSSGADGRAAAARLRSTVVAVPADGQGLALEARLATLGGP